MRARKKFVVIAYDIVNNRRRRKVEKEVSMYGVRVNKSVFECMLSDSQLEKLKASVLKLLDAKTDQVVYYTLCLDCFASIVYQPERRRPAEELGSTSIV